MEPLNKSTFIILEILCATGIVFCYYMATKTGKKWGGEKGLKNKLDTVATKLFVENRKRALAETNEMIEKKRREAIMFLVVDAALFATMISLYFLHSYKQ